MEVSGGPGKQHGRSTDYDSTESRLTRRRFVGGADDVGRHHVGIVRVDHRVLGRLAEQVVRVVDEVLVERIVLRDQNRERPGVAPTGASGLLPHRSAGSRIAGQDRCVERRPPGGEVGVLGLGDVGMSRQ